MSRWMIPSDEDWPMADVPGEGPTSDDEAAFREAHNPDDELEAQMQEAYLALGSHPEEDFIDYSVREGPDSDEEHEFHYEHYGRDEELYAQAVDDAYGRIRDEHVRPARRPSVGEPEPPRSPTPSFYTGSEGDDKDESLLESSPIYSRRLQIPAQAVGEVRSVTVPKTIELRILRILSAQSAHEDLRCELDVATFDTAHSGPPSAAYEALSYTWGDASHFRYIWLNSRRWPIGSNLWTALRALRRCGGGGESRTVWADALCINQADTTEREYMVSQMHVIYRLARRTLAWIGEATPQADRAAAFIFRQICGPPAAAEPSSNEPLLDQAIIRRIKRARSGSGVPVIPPLELQAWDDLADFFGRAWYTRAWIVQEVACARECVLKCGDWELDAALVLGDGGLLHRVCAAARAYGDAMPIGIASVLEECGGQSWTLSRPGGSTDLGSLVCVNRHRRAKEPKDKIYAFTSMLSAEQETGHSNGASSSPPKPVVDLYPSYEEPTVVTYKRAATQVLRQCGHTKLLAECEAIDEAALHRLAAADGLPRTWLLALPTWVPNWANPRLASHGLWGGYSAPSPLPFTATGDLLSDTSGVLFRPPPPSPDGLPHDMLTVYGVVLDSILHRGRDLFGGGDDIGPAAFLDDVCDVLKQDRTAYLGVVLTKDDAGDLLAGVARTLTLDRSAAGDRYAHQMTAPERRDAFRRAIRGRRFFTTGQGFMGLGPLLAAEGDIVALVSGCHVPIVLRERSLGGGPRPAVMGPPDCERCRSRILQEIYDEYDEYDELGLSGGEEEPPGILDVERRREFGPPCDGDCFGRRGPLVYDVVGEAYVHGVMNGEWASLLRGGLSSFDLDGGSGYSIADDQDAMPWQKRPLPLAWVAPEMRNLHRGKLPADASSSLWASLIQLGPKA